MPFPFSGKSSWTGWLSDIFLQKRALAGNTMVVSQADMSKDGWMQWVEAYERDL